MCLDFKIKNFFRITCLLMTTTALASPVLGANEVSSPPVLVENEVPPVPGANGVGPVPGANGVPPVPVENETAAWDLIQDYSNQMAMFGATLHELNLAKTELNRAKEEHATSQKKLEAAELAAQQAENNKAQLPQLDFDKALSDKYLATDNHVFYEAALGKAQKKVEELDGKLKKSRAETETALNKYLDKVKTTGTQALSQDSLNKYFDRLTDIDKQKKTEFNEITKLTQLTKELRDAQAAFDLTFPDPDATEDQKTEVQDGLSRAEFAVDDFEEALKKRAPGPISEVYPALSRLLDITKHARELTSELSTKTAKLAELEAKSENTDYSTELYDISNQILKVQEAREAVESAGTEEAPRLKDLLIAERGTFLDKKQNLEQEAPALKDTLDALQAIEIKMENIDKKIEENRKKVSYVQSLKDLSQKLKVLQGKKHDYHNVVFNGEVITKTDLDAKRTALETADKDFTDGVKAFKATYSDLISDKTALPSQIIDSFENIDTATKALDGLYASLSEREVEKQNLINKMEDIKNADRNRLFVMERLHTWFSTLHDRGKALSSASTQEQKTAASTDFNLAKTDFDRTLQRLKDSYPEVFADDNLLADFLKIKEVVGDPQKYLKGEDADKAQQAELDALREKLDSNLAKTTKQFDGIIKLADKLKALRSAEINHLAAVLNPQGTEDDTLSAFQSAQSAFQAVVTTLDRDQLSIEGEPTALQKLIDLQKGDLNLEDKLTLVGQKAKELQEIKALSDLSQKLREAETQPENARAAAREAAKTAFDAKVSGLASVYGSLPLKRPILDNFITLQKEKLENDSKIADLANMEQEVGQTKGDALAELAQKQSELQAIHELTQKMLALQKAREAVPLEGTQNAIKTANEAAEKARVALNEKLESIRNGSLFRGSKTIQGLLRVHSANRKLNVKLDTAVLQAKDAERRAKARVQTLHQNITTLNATEKRLFYKKQMAEAERDQQQADLRDITDLTKLINDLQHAKKNRLTATLNSQGEADAEQALKGAQSAFDNKVKELNGAYSNLAETKPILANLIALNNEAVRLTDTLRQIAGRKTDEEPIQTGTAEFESEKETLQATIAEKEQELANALAAVSELEQIKLEREALKKEKEKLQADLLKNEQELERAQAGRTELEQAELESEAIEPSLSELDDDMTEKERVELKNRIAELKKAISRGKEDIEKRIAKLKKTDGITPAEISAGQSISLAIAGTPLAFSGDDKFAIGGGFAVLNNQPSMGMSLGMKIEQNINLKISAGKALKGKPYGVTFGAQIKF